MIEKISKRVKNSIICQVNKLIKKYGLDETRCVINKIFESIKRKQKLEESIALRERELESLKGKLK